MPGRKYTAQQRRLLYEAAENARPGMSANATTRHKIVTAPSPTDTGAESFDRQVRFTFNKVQTWSGFRQAYLRSYRAEEEILPVDIQGREGIKKVFSD